MSVGDVVLVNDLVERVASPESSENEDAAVA
jgi:hypothetical protein